MFSRIPIPADFQGEHGVLTSPEPWEAEMTQHGVFYWRKMWVWLPRRYRPVGSMWGPLAHLVGHFTGFLVCPLLP